MTWNALLTLTWSIYSVCVLTCALVWANYGVNANGEASAWWLLLLPLFIFACFLGAATMTGETRL